MSKFYKIDKQAIITAKNYSQLLGSICENGINGTFEKNYCNGKNQIDGFINGEKIECKINEGNRFTLEYIRQFDYVVYGYVNNHYLKPLFEKKEFDKIYFYFNNCVTLYLIPTEDLIRSGFLRSCRDRKNNIPYMSVKWKKSAKDNEPSEQLKEFCKQYPRIIPFIK